MSTYYSFYIGYRTKDKIFHAYGPFDKFNNLRPILYKSRSFISDLYRDFYKIKIEDLDEFLKDKFVYSGYENEPSSDLWFLPVGDLPETNYMKLGYFLTDEISEYLEDSDQYDYYFSERYSITEYSIKLAAAVKNEDLEEIERLKKFSYFCYPDYNSKEYESALIHNFLSYQGPFDSYEINENTKNNGEEIEDIIILLHIDY